MAPPRPRGRVSLGGSLPDVCFDSFVPILVPAVWRRVVLLAPLVAVTVALAARSAQPPDVVTLSIVGTTDLHGYVFPREGRGGLAVFGGYLANLRAARAADGGGVVLLDAGDTWLGGIESNMSEGAVVVDAYNALGYTAAAVGNHDLEFGAVDRGRSGWPTATCAARSRRAPGRRAIRCWPPTWSMPARARRWTGPTCGRRPS